MYTSSKEYAKKYNLHWGFVCDIAEELYINNTIYTEDMSGDNWIPLDDVLRTCVHRRFKSVAA